MILKVFSVIISTLTGFITGMVSASFFLLPIPLLAGGAAVGIPCGIIAVLSQFDFFVED